MTQSPAASGSPAREHLERHQVWLYLAAIGLGLGFGAIAPGIGARLEPMIWPFLAFLLYATFTQVPLRRLPRAFADRRFMAAVLVGNFVLVPVLVAGLLAITPDDPAIRLGVLLVLLVPCTDWFVTFTQLAGGDSSRAIAVTPLNLVLQFALLPLYLWLFLGGEIVGVASAERLALVFLALVALPLALAWATQRRSEGAARPSRLVQGLAILPVPLLALVVFLIAASQVAAVMGSLVVLPRLLVTFSAYLLGAALIGVVLARAFRLRTAAGRALVFSLATRNSFVVLPFALALPAGMELAAIVIVFQSLVELLGMVLFLWWVPRKLLPRTPSTRRVPG